MAFKNILNLFKRKEQQRERFAGFLGKDSAPSGSATRPVAVLDDLFEESGSGVFSQLRKYPFGNFSEFLETQRTSFNKHTIFIVEILDDAVNAAIVSRKGVFLDIGFLKSYTFEQLKEIYFRIVPGASESVAEIRNSIENIVSIVAYDVVYALPRKIVIIENGNGELRELSIPLGRFTDEAGVTELMLRELSIESGYSADQIVYSAIRKPVAKGDKFQDFLVSLVEKEYFESVDNYVKEAGFALKKIHSLQSSLFSSFALKDRQSIMRIHVQEHTAYALHKMLGEAYEFDRFDLNDRYDDLLSIALQMEEVILSGGGDYYEMLKSAYLEAGVHVRWWNYGYDLSRCIIRLEEGISLDNRFANIIATAYYELFNMRLALIRLGVGTKLSLYEFVAVNLSLLPIALIVFALIGTFGWYLYEQRHGAALEETQKSYNTLFAKEKQGKSDIASRQSAIDEVKRKSAMIEKIMHDKVDIRDAAVLFEIASKLPDDMILTRIEKTRVMQGTKKKQVGVETIIVEGRCYLERSLLNYISSLRFEGKSVYLTGMKDTQKTRFVSNEEANRRSIESYLQEMEAYEQRLQQSSSTELNEPIHPPEVFTPKGTSVMYADTLNNSFTLEIR